jgi:tight adherence protein B
MSALPAILLLGAGGLLTLAALDTGGAGRRRGLQRLAAAVRRAPAAAEPLPAGPLPLPAWLETLFHRAKLSPRRLLPGWIFLSCALPAAGWLLGGGGAALLGAALALGGGPLALRWLAARRSRQVQDALPAFVDRLRQHLMAGASIQHALKRANAPSPPALAGLFQVVDRRMSHGAPLGDTLEAMAAREGLPELALLASAIAASLRFGGRLTDTLGGLSQSMRDRQRVERELHAATAEVRASVLVLSLIVPGAAGAMMLINPANMAWFLDPEQGRTMLYVATALYLGGLLLLRRVARVTY